jgi:hypothetical protein
MSGVRIIASAKDLRRISISSSRHVVVTKRFAAIIVRIVATDEQIVRAEVAQQEPRLAIMAQARTETDPGADHAEQEIRLTTEVPTMA